MLKKLTVMALALIIALASVCLPSFADSGADISAAVQSGDAPGESAAQEGPGGAEAGPGASAGADGEEAVLYDDAETALSIMNELPATITATQAVQAGHVMRLKAEEPDLNTVVFKNGDGTRTAYQYAVPVKYVENGEIKDKSSRLVATDKGGYAYENEANEVKTYFPQGLGAKGARLEYGGYALELTPVTAETLGVYSAGSSLAAGGSVLRNVTEAADGMNYAGALGEGISLRYTPTLTGLKEDIILDSYTGRSSFSFRLRTEGLELCEISGNWYLSDPESGEIVVELGEIYIHDSYAGNVAEGEQSAHETYGCITAETIEEGEEYILSVHAPAEYLSAPGTVYPVYIDPTFNVVNTYIQDTHISSGYPSKNYNTASLLNLGHGTSSKSTRILVMITNMVNGQTRPGLDASSINSATYHMYCTSSYTSNPYVDVYRIQPGAGGIGTTWEAATATWNNASSSTLSGATLVSSTRVGNKGWYEFDVTDAYVKWWQMLRHNGLLFKMRVESATENYWRQFASATYSDSSKLPYLQVVYDEPESLSINPNPIQLYSGEKYSPTAVLSPSGAAYGILYWSSSNTGVATIDYATGQITALTPGTTTISVVMNTGSVNLSTSCTLTVLSGTPPVDSGAEYYIFNNWCCKPSMIKDGSMTDGTKVWQMNWSASNSSSMKWKVIRLYNGYYLFRPLNSSTLAMSAYTTNVTVKNIGTSNSAANVPTHAQWRITKYSDGRVKLSPRSNTSLNMQTNRANNGAAEDIIVASSTPAYAYYRFVKVNEYIPTTGIAIPTNIYLLKNGTYKFSPIVMPSNATFKKYGWEKQNSSIAQISDSTGNVATGQGEGTAWVRARCLDTNITGTCTVNVHFLEGGKDYLLRNADSDLIMGVDDQTAANSYLWQEESAFFDSQKFRFELVSNTSGPYLYIKNTDSGLYLGVENNSTAHDAAVRLYAKNTSADGQKFKITRTTGEKIQIMPKTGESGSPQRVLSPKNGALVNFNMVCQRNINSSNIAHEWYIEEPKYEYIPLEGQQKSNWCWAASARMLSFSYYDVTKTQTQAVVYVKGADINDGGTVYEAMEAASYYQNGANNLVAYEWKIYSEQNIRRFIDDGHPIYIGRGWYDYNNEKYIRSGGHATVIFGYIWNEKYNRYDYLIRDPWPVNEGKTLIMSYQKLVNSLNLPSNSEEDSDGGIWECVLVHETSYSDQVIDWALAN